MATAGAVLHWQAGPHKPKVELAKLNVQICGRNMQPRQAEGGSSFNMPQLGAVILSILSTAVSISWRTWPLASASWVPSEVHAPLNVHFVSEL